MTTLLLLALLLGGSGLIVLGVRALRRVRETLRRPTVTIAALTPGEVELSGEVFALDAPLTVDGAPGYRAVAVQTRVEKRVLAGKHYTWKTVETHYRVVRAELRDGTGACELDLSSVELVGDDLWIEGQPGAEFHTLVTAIPVGARVLVAGAAAVSGIVSGEGYREARERFVVGADSTGALLVSVLDERATLRRALLGPAITLGAGALLVLLAAWLAWLSALFDATPR